MVAEVYAVLVPVTQAAIDNTKHKYEPNLKYV